MQAIRRKEHLGHTEGYRRAIGGYRGYRDTPLTDCKNVNLEVIGTFVLVLAPRFGYRDTTQPAVFGALHSYLGAA